jgi:hypothetical protein
MTGPTPFIIVGAIYLIYIKHMVAIFKVLFTCCKNITIGNYACVYMQMGWGKYPYHGPLAGSPINKLYYMIP